MYNKDEHHATVQYCVESDFEWDMLLAVGMISCCLGSTVQYSIL